MGVCRRKSNQDLGVGHCYIPQIDVRLISFAASKTRPLARTSMWKAATLGTGM